MQPRPSCRGPEARGQEADQLRFSRQESEEYSQGLFSAPEESPGSNRGIVQHTIQEEGA